MKKHTLPALAAYISTCLATAACGPTLPADQPLSGTINGDAWTAGAGLISDSSADDMSGTVYGDDNDLECGGDTTTATYPQLLVNVPKEPGTYELNLNLFDLANARTFTVVPAPGENIIMGEGVMVVEASDAGRRVGLLASEGDVTLDGFVDVTFCDTQD